MKDVFGKKVCETLTEVLNPNYTALLIVDAQNDFCSNDGKLNGIGKNIDMCKAVIPEIRNLLEAAKEHRILRVFIQQITLPEGLSDSPEWLYRKYKAHSITEYTIMGTWGSEFVDELKPKSNEVVVEKHRPSAFVDTKLDLILRSNQIKTVIMTGVVTEGCVESTARDASFKDYCVVYAEDCIGSTNKEIHDASLKIARFRGYDVVESKTIIDAWKETLI